LNQRTSGIQALSARNFLTGRARVIQLGKQQITNKNPNPNPNHAKPRLWRISQKPNRKFQLEKEQEKRQKRDTHKKLKNKRKTLKKKAKVHYATLGSGLLFSRSRSVWFMHFHRDGDGIPHLVLSSEWPTMNNFPVVTFVFNCQIHTNDEQKGRMCGRNVNVFNGVIA